MTVENPYELLKKLDALRQARGLTTREMAGELGIPWETFRQWFGDRQRKPTPRRDYLEKIKAFVASCRKELGMAAVAAVDVVTQQEVQGRAEKIKHLLLVLETELRFFRDGKTVDRDVFRAMLDPADVGYISSLLGMLGDEDQFKRWRTLTNYQFNHFRKERSVGR